MAKRVLVVGKGGREHALAWKLSRAQAAPGSRSLRATAAQLTSMYPFPKQISPLW